MNNAVEIEGIDEVLRALEGLPSKLTSKILYDAHKEILSKNVLKDVRAALPYSARTRRGVKVVKARGTANGVYIGVTTDSFWLRFLEFGTSDRLTRGTIKTAEGISRGRIDPARPNAVSAINDRTNAVLQAIGKEYPEMIVNAIGKQLKKYKISK